MKKLSRRQFNQAVGLGFTGLATPYIAKSQVQARVVIVGGGAGGATAARYIAKNANDALHVTLIEDSINYTSCFFSNLYLAGERSFDSITHSYKKLASDYRIELVNGFAISIDRNNKQVGLKDGRSVPYDRLVVAPGIDMDFDSVPGYTDADAQTAPHAWLGGSQTALLKQKLDALQDGDAVVIVPPPNPYRCPPGPYERASSMAHLFKTRGMDNCRITILDVKPSFSKQALFFAGWQEHYPGVIDWIGPEVHGGIINVDAEAGTVETDLDSFTADLLNVIPKQRAGSIAEAAGLTNASGFCPIDGASMRSTIDKNVFVVGDASIAGAMPKSGFSANSQARVAAMHVLGDLLDAPVKEAIYSNTCWSMLTKNDGVKVGAQYASVNGNIESTSTFISQANESVELRKATYEQSFGWYASISADIFG